MNLDLARFWFTKSVIFFRGFNPRVSYELRLKSGISFKV